MNDPRNELDALRDRIENPDHDAARAIEDPADRDILIQFSNRLDLLREEYGAYRHAKLLRHCTRMVEHVGGLAESLEDRAAAEAIVRWTIPTTHRMQAVLVYVEKSNSGLGDQRSAHKPHENRTDAERCGGSVCTGTEAEWVRTAGSSYTRFPCSWPRNDNHAVPPNRPGGSGSSLAIMVDVTGHIGMALLFAAPAWIVWGRRGALGFTAFTLVTAMLPDTDLVLRHVLPITHHGVTHTILFVVLVSIISGGSAAKWLTARFNDHSWIESTDITGETVFVFATTGLIAGGISHLFADVLSAPDIAPPLSPFWPFYPAPVVVDVIYYDSPVWNFGLLAVAVALHLVLARYESYPLDHRFRAGVQDDGEEFADVGTGEGRV